MLQGLCVINAQKCKAKFNVYITNYKQADKNIRLNVKLTDSKPVNVQQNSVKKSLYNFKTLYKTQLPKTVKRVKLENYGNTNSYWLLGH